MPSFSVKSLAILATAHEDLRNLFYEVIKYRDCTVVCGFRNEADQNAAKAAGNSNASWPNSPHNHNPSLAVDVVPYIDGEPNFDDQNCLMFAGFVMGIAAMMNLSCRVRSGADWNSNQDVHDQHLHDMDHFEIILRPDEVSNG
jgi:peptidoglycan LD-endopeptidase CwlK